MWNLYQLMHFTLHVLSTMHEPNVNPEYQSIEWSVNHLYANRNQKKTNILNQ